MLKKTSDKPQSHNYKQLTKSHRRQLLITTFILLLAGLSTGLVANIILTGNMPAIILFIVAIALSIGIIAFYGMTRHFHATAFAVAALLMAVYILYLDIAQHPAFVLYLFPSVVVVAFYLTGRFKGALFSFVPFIISIVYLLFNQQTWEAATFGVGSLINFVAATLAFIAFMMFYEITLHNVQTELEKTNQRLHVLSITDALTGIYNRAWLDREMERRLEEAEKGKGFSIIVADLDNFKRINDNYGHVQGDRFLQECATLLQNTVEDKCSVGRWGGEEFLIICDAASVAEVKDCAETIRRAIQNHPTFKEACLTISLGVAIYREHDNEITMIQRGDQGLYQVKADGKNSICIWEDEKQTCLDI